MRALALALLWFAQSAVPAAEVPYLRGRVVDDAEILSAAARQRLARQLRAHEERTTNQVVVLTVPTLASASIEDYAIRVFEAWKLGQSGRDNGVLLVIAPQERRMRIEVGYGLEGDLTDAEAARIIRNVITPRFRDAAYDAGVEQGVTAIIATLEGKLGSWDIAPEPQDGRGLHINAPDMSIAERILVSAFVFGIIGLFTAIGLATPGGAGWFLYLFLIPFWSMFPLAIFGSGVAIVIFGVYLLAFPVTKLLLRRSQWYRRAAEDLRTSGGFSGGGGRSGGGGASGSW